MKKVEKRICVCKEEEKNHVYIDTVEGVGTEFESLAWYYCIQCNSFWRDP
mgnify:FL=1